MTTTELARGSDLIPGELFDRLVSRIVRDEKVNHELATRITDQALAFLGACASARETLAPSAMVDIGWHTFILYTREYSAFCNRVAGRFIHHDPTDDGRPDASPGDVRRRTVAAIRAAGYVVNEDLWLDMSSKCTQCADGCTHSGGCKNDCHMTTTIAE